MRYTVDSQRGLLGNETTKPSILGAKRFDLSLESGDSVAELLGSLLKGGLTLLLLDTEASCRETYTPPC